ncbi:MAG: hypothetical protein LBB83_07230 [Treponema sp.]|nr:hypothetical protein [Treponema sp.]
MEADFRCLEIFWVKFSIRYRVSGKRYKQIARSGVCPTSAGIAGFCYIKRETGVGVSRVYRLV